MEQKQKIFLAVGLLAIVFVALGVGFFAMGGSDSSSSASDDSSSIMFIIMISQIPIWMSLAVASREKRKKKEAEGRKGKEKRLYDADDEDYFEDKVLSEYDGEIVGYDEVEEKNTLHNS